MSESDKESRFNIWLDSEFCGVGLDDAEVSGLRAAFMAGSALSTTNATDGLPCEVWVMCSRIEGGKYSADFVADFREGAMDHAKEFAGMEEAGPFGPPRVARYVLAQPSAIGAPDFEAVGWYDNGVMRWEDGKEPPTGAALFRPKGWGK